MWFRKLAFLGGRRRSALAAVVVVMGLLLAGCGSSPQSSARPGPAFPSTPAGIQAQWLFQAVGKPPIPDAEIRAHFDAALVPHALTGLNVVLTGIGQLGLVSVASTQPNSVMFVMSVRGGQRFRVGLTVDAHGLINGLTTLEVPPAASPASVLPALAPGWVAQPATFQAFLAGDL